MCNHVTDSVWLAKTGSFVGSNEMSFQGPIENIFIINLRIRVFQGHHHLFLSRVFYT
jgi:hypothetical protein